MIEVGTQTAVAAALFLVISMDFNFKGSWSVLCSGHIFTTLHGLVHRLFASAAILIKSATKTFVDLTSTCKYTCGRNKNIWGFFFKGLKK